MCGDVFCTSMPVASPCAYGCPMSNSAVSAGTAARALSNGAAVQSVDRAITVLEIWHAAARAG